MTNALPLIARILIALVFIPGAIFKIIGFDQTVGFMESVGFPAAAVFLIIGAVIEIVGGLSVLLGYKSEWGAAILVVFLLVATIVFHRDIADQNQFVQVTKNLAIMGGLLLVIHFGPGPYALGSTPKKKPAPIEVDEGDSED